jgi:AraC-like DNA-binding protein
MNVTGNPTEAERHAVRHPLRVREGFPGERLVILPREIAARCRRLPVVQDLYVTDIGHFPSARFHYVQRSKPVVSTILIYCTDGGGWCRIRGRRWRVRRGDALFLPAGTPHAYGAERSAPWSILWVHFTGERMAKYTQALDVSPDRPVVHVPDSARMVQAFEELYRYVGHGYTDADLLGLSTELTRFLGLFKVGRRAPHAKGRYAEERILASMAYMRANLERPLSLTELARQACLSPSHYVALFRKHANASPLAFFTRLRMQAACALLDGTDEPVKTVAQRVGYGDQLYFSRCFHRFMGLAPSAYRMANKER